MTDEERAHWNLVLDNRAERFRKLVALKAPSYIIASDLVLLIKAVAAIYPKEFGSVFAEFIQRAARMAFNLCVFCGKHHGRGHNSEEWCVDCEASAVVEAAGDDLEADDDDA